jgi:hypothetical protein
VSRSAIESTLKRKYLYNEGNTQARSGRLREYTDAIEHKILRHILLHLKDIYTQLILACNLSIKKTTIKTILT